jgi:hypothetical protein
LGFRSPFRVFNEHLDFHVPCTWHGEYISHIIVVTGALSAAY